MHGHPNPPRDAPSITPEGDGALRIDRWLCNVRLFRSRALAVAAIEAGQVTVNGVVVKSAKAVRAGDRVCIGQAPDQRELEVLATSARRVGAARVAGLYRVAGGDTPAHGARHANATGALARTDDHGGRRCTRS